MRVMVTGGGGLVGAKIVRRLLAEGLDVVSLDVSAHQPRLAALAGDARLVRIGCDVRDAAAVQDAIRDTGVDQIVHMAALLGPTTENEPALGFAVNVVGAANVFEAAGRAGVARVCYATSVAVYGDQSEYGEATVVDEGSHRNPYSLYGHAKVMNEETAKVVARDSGLDIRGLRIAAVFGHGRATGRSSAISRMISAAAVGEGAMSDVAATQPAPVIYVDDVAECMTRLCLAERLAHPVYCGPSQIVTVQDAVDAIRRWIPEAELGFEDGAATYPSILRVSDARWAAEVGYAPPSFGDRVRDQIEEARAVRG